MTHTPGPWKALGCSVWEHNPDKSAKIQMIHNICNTNSGYSDEVNRANALLIAAAPAMLEALKLCVDALEFIPCEFIPCRARFTAKEAIRLAEGRG